MTAKIMQQHVSEQIEKNALKFLGGWEKNQNLKLPYSVAFCCPVAGF